MLMSLISVITKYLTRAKYRGKSRQAQDYPCHLTAPTRNGPLGGTDNERAWMISPGPCTKRVLPACWRLLNRDVDEPAVSPRRAYETQRREQTYRKWTIQVDHDGLVSKRLKYGKAKETLYRCYGSERLYEVSYISS